MWTDPVESGFIFAIANLFFLLLIFGGYTVVTLVSYLLISFLAVAGVYVNVTLFTQRGKPNPLVEKLGTAQVQIDESGVNATSRVIILATNLFVAEFRKAAQFTDKIFSIKVFFSLVGLGFIVGNLFSTETLLYLATLKAFILPRLYREKQADIDRLLALAQAHVRQYANLAWEKLPPVVKSKFQ